MMEGQTWDLRLDGEGDNDADTWRAGGRSEGLDLRSKAAQKSLFGRILPRDHNPLCSSPSVCTPKFDPTKGDG